MYATNKLSWSLYLLGLVIVVGSHIYMLTAGVPADQMMGHAVINLVAAVLLAAGWLSRKA